VRAMRGAPENRDQVNSVIHSEAVIEPVWRCTCRRYSSVFGDTLEGRDRVELRDTFGGHDRAILDMHLEVMKM